MLQEQIVGARAIAIDDRRQHQAVVVDQEGVDAVDIHDQLTTLRMERRELRDGPVNDRERRRIAGRDEPGVEGIVGLAATDGIFDCLDNLLEGEPEFL